MNEITYRLKPITKKIIMFHSKTNTIVLEEINEDEELFIDTSIDKYGELLFKRNNNIIAKNNNILLYGEVNLKSDDDINLINSLNIIDEEKGNYIYSNYNFNTKEVTTINGIIKKYQTFKPLLWFKYCYSLLDNPQRIIIYRQNVRRNRL